MGPTFNTRSFNADGSVTIDTNPSNDVKISPIASVCSSCHDDPRSVERRNRYPRARVRRFLTRVPGLFLPDLPALTDFRLRVIAPILTLTCSRGHRHAREG